MGCHTWAYRKYRQDEVKTIKKVMVKELMSGGEYLPNNKIEDDYVDAQQKIYKSLVEDYPDDKKLLKLSTDRDALKRHLEKTNTKIQTLIADIEKCEDIKALIPLCKLWHNMVLSTDLKVINDAIYEEIGFDEPCRIYGYPEDTFLNADEFINWIKKEESKGETIVRLYINDDSRNFIDGICPQTEKAIRDYWQKYNNEVYVEFG